MKPNEMLSERNAKYNLFSIIKPFFLGGENGVKCVLIHRWYRETDPIVNGNDFRLVFELPTAEKVALGASTFAGNTKN